MFGSLSGVRWWAIVSLSIMSAMANQRQPPNIVFIMVDDMGWNDVSFHGSDQILTPNIDSLAYKGVILQQYYSEAICTPARTALLTGKYPMRLGMQGQPLFNSEDRGIPLTERLLPSYLKDLGYSTHLVGKWHVGMSREEFLPTARGYDTHYGIRGGYVDYYTYNIVQSWPNGQLLFGLDMFNGSIPQEEEQRYIVDAFTDRAVQVIQNHNTTTPLFLHVTHNGPHAGNDGAPLQPPLYSPVHHRHIANSNRRLYADVVSHIDRSVGQIVRALADRNLLNDTIIIFASDNGAPTVGYLRNWGINLPLRGQKDTPWEGAVRVPAFIWHSSFKPRVWDGLMHITDWLPTLMAATGGNFCQKIDGVNQWASIVQNSVSQRREVLLAIEDSSKNMYAAYRIGDYKVVLGNLTGLSNDYYGDELMINRAPTQEYYPTLKNCDVSRKFEEIGWYFGMKEVNAMRSAATVKPEDTINNSTPCLPTLNRGCLYNIRHDPTERHDLWNQASQLAALLTSRIQSLWSQQLRRGPTNLNIEADPANFGYNWLPWINSNYKNDSLVDNLNLLLNVSSYRISSIGSTQAKDIFQCCTNCINCNFEDCFLSV